MGSDAQSIPNIDWRVDDLRAALEEAIGLLDEGKLRSIAFACVLNVKDSHPLDYNIVTLVSGAWRDDIWLLKGATTRLQERFGKELDETGYLSDEV